MTLIDASNLIFALLSIGLGAIGWLAPRYVMEVLDTAPTKSSMGLSEVRASAGALFVGLGVGAILISSSDAYAILGAAWLGAAVGRITSIILDGPTPKKWGFFLCEVVVGLGAIAINL
jgi:hypothetical protein